MGAELHMGSGWQGHGPVSAAIPSPLPYWFWGAKSLLSLLESDSATELTSFFVVSRPQTADSDLLSTSGDLLPEGQLLAWCSSNTVCIISLPVHGVYPCLATGYLLSLSWAQLIGLEIPKLLFPRMHKAEIWTHSPIYGPDLHYEMDTFSFWDTSDISVVPHI